MNPIKVLLVEDEPDIQAVAWLSLDAVGGFTVELCSSGRETLERLPEVAPDLVLMDVMMPGLDGPSTLARMRAEGRTTPVIFMTAKVQPHEVAELLATGALGVISKPFDPMTLAKTVRKLWEENHVHVVDRVR